MIPPNLKKLVDQLPDSGITTGAVQKKIYKKIHRLFPVPNDYEILWADVISFGGYPAGVVITDQALIVKATKKEVKRINAETKNNRAKKSRRVKPLKEIYQIIPWEYYSPDCYELEIKEDKKGTRRYVIKAGKDDLAEFKTRDLYELFSSYNEEIREEQKKAEEIIKSQVMASIPTTDAKNVAYGATYGRGETKTGHGIYAEDVGRLLDLLSGEISTVVGRDNAKNGPDKIVDGMQVQCKYCKTAYSTVKSCFAKNSLGLDSFRYFDLNGKPMKVEVPSDQYTQAVDYMKERITNGQVPGVDNPDYAYDIIRKGKLTYKQTLNLAKAGTIESVVFDAATGAITCLSALGISAIFAFAGTYWRTKDWKKASETALETGLQVYGLSFIGYVFASQLAKTNVPNAIKPLINRITTNLSKDTIQKLVNFARQLAGKKAIYGAAAEKSFAKILGTNIITEIAFFLVFSVPDTYRVFSRKISKSQYLKNMLSLTGTFLGGALTIGGIALIATNPPGLLVTGLATAAGGMLGGYGIKVIGNRIREDDAVITSRMFNAITVKLLLDYMLTDKEQSQLIELLDKDKKALIKLQRRLLKSSAQGKEIEEYLRPKFDDIVKRREKISKIEDHNLSENPNNINLEEHDHGM